MDIKNGFQAFIPHEDTLFAFDTAMRDRFVIPIQVPYTYLESELTAMETAELQRIATERNAYADTDHRNLLIKAILNTQQVPIVFGTADNAFGDPEYVAGINAITPELAVSVFYPAMSIRRIGWTFDLARLNKRTRRKISWSSDGNLVLQSPQPFPITLTYQLDTFALSMKHANYIKQNVMLKSFYTNIRVNLGSVWGEQPMYMQLTGSRDTSQLEAPGERAERLIRETLDYQLSGWLPQECVYVKTVKALEFAFTDGKDELGSVDIIPLPKLIR